MSGSLPTLSAEHYVAIVEHSDDAIITKDRDAIITSWNPAAERIYGWTAEEAVGSPISILIPPQRAGEERRILDRVLAGERVEHYETERVTKHGDLKVLSLTVSPIYGEDGQVAYASVIARDMTPRHRSHELNRRLQELTSALSAETGPDRAIDVLLEQAVGALGAVAGSVGLLRTETADVHLVGSRGHSEEGLSGWQSFPLSADVPMAQAIRRNEPVWVTSGEQLTREFAGLQAERVRFDALAVIPLAVEGKPFGAVSVSFDTPRQFDLEERAFLLAAVHQAAQMLERARVFEAERVAAQRLSFLADASDLLSRSLDVDESLRSLVDLIAARFADWCAIDLIDESGEIRNAATAHRDPDRVASTELMRTRYQVDPTAEIGVANVIRTGESELYAEVTDELLQTTARDQDHLRLVREVGLTSAMIVPLRAGGRALGALTMVSGDADRHFDQGDVELAEDVARRAGLALDNALAYRREHEAAVILQRALLPESLPEVPGLEFAARYEPAAPGLEVGGDWYEVVPCADGTFAITIGDVAGRGIRAASTMGRLRPALRGFVADGHSPDEVMRRLDALVKEAERPELTTVFHLRYDPATGTGEYVRAGHPPAMLRLPDGEVRELREAGAPPVGILPDVEFHVHRTEVPPGSLLLLYTDGLIERRGEPLPESLERLRRSVADCGAGAAECLDALAREYGTHTVPDDVAMLAMAVARNGSG